MNPLEKRYLNLQSQLTELLNQAHRTSLPTLIAVSKSQPIDAIETLYQLGHRDFGENYVQELLIKNQYLNDRGIRDIHWHFIGHLQRNKVKALLPFVNTIHAVDSLELASEIAKRWRTLQKSNPMNIFLEVNLHSEPTKTGFSPELLKTSLQPISELRELKPLGLMCIPNREKDSRESFAALRILEESCRPWTRGFLSMGMSNDYAIALQEGATHLRVGTALFGERKPSITQ
jgi:hypothetical protein